MQNLGIVITFTALIMTMVGCSRTTLKPQTTPFKIKSYEDRYRDCVMGFIKVGVSPKDAGLLCDKALRERDAN